MKDTFEKSTTQDPEKTSVQKVDDKFDKQDDESKSENETKGIALKVFSILLQSVNWVVARFIYLNNPDLIWSQFILLRSICVVIILILYLNKDLKKVLIDSPSQNKTMMVVTILTGAARTTITYTAV